MYVHWREREHEEEYQMVKEEPLAMATLKNVECRNYSFVLL
jgi:hypothetical protein